MARLQSCLQRSCHFALQIRDVIHTLDLAAPRGVLPLPACVAQMCPLQILEQKDSVFIILGLKTEVGGQAPGTRLSAHFHLKLLDCRASLWESGENPHPSPCRRGLPPAALCGSVKPGSQRFPTFVPLSCWWSLGPRGSSGPGKGSSESVGGVEGRRALQRRSLFVSLVT